MSVCILAVFYGQAIYNDFWFILWLKKADFGCLVVNLFINIMSLNETLWVKYKGI